MTIPPLPGDAGSTGTASPLPEDEAVPRPAEGTLEGPADEDTASRSVTSRVGRYLVLERLGHGGMGVVLEAYDPELDRRVALKLLHPERARGASRLRLLREAQALARLSHPSVVQVYDVGVDGAQVFMAMELVRGRTISAWLAERPRAWTEIVARFVAAGRGLQAAHAAGLVHRDFKPHNVLVGDDGRVRVADFGLAGVEDAPPAASVRDGPAATSYLATSLTATGAVLGTPRYMAPEQHAGLEVGPAADQFAFCVALHEAVLGSHPFGGETSLELVANVVEGRLVAPSGGPSVPKWLVAAIRRGLARDPADRHPDMEALLHVLEREPLRRRRRLRTGGLLLALGLGLVASVWLARAGPAPCRGGETAIAEVWSAPRREAVTAALAGATDAGDPTTAATVVGTLDRYAEAWSETHRAVCLEHRDEAMSQPSFEAAMGCLQRGRAALSGVVETVATGTPEVVGAAAVAAAGLPAPAACRDREQLSREPGPPVDPAAAASAAALRERLARAEAVHDAGAVGPALDELAALEPEVAALGHAPLSAERALVAGRLAMERRDWRHARLELSAAATLALGSRADAIAAEAMARGLFVEAMLLAPAELRPDDEAVARALVERLGSPPGLAALLDNNIGVRRAMSGAGEEAARAFAQALARADAATDVDPVDHCGYIVNAARHTSDPVARDAAFARAHRLATQWLGPAHEKTLEIAWLHAQHTVDPAEAITRLAPVCARTRARGRVEWSSCLCPARLAELHEQRGAEPEAAAALAEALRCFDDAGALAEVDLAALVRGKLEAHAAILRADPAAALVRLDAVERGLRAHHELPWVALELADVALLRARSLHARGRGAEAIDPLRAAMATYDRVISSTYEQPPRERRERAARLLAELEDQRRSSSPSSSSQR